MINKIKNSEAEIRVHKYGICVIWNTYLIKGQELNSNNSNSFSLESKEGLITFYSRDECLGKVKKLIEEIPKEYQSEFLERQNLLELVLE